MTCKCGHSEEKHVHGDCTAMDFESEQCRCEAFDRDTRSHDPWVGTDAKETELRQRAKKGDYMPPTIPPGMTIEDMPPPVTAVTTTIGEVRMTRAELSTLVPDPDNANEHPDDNVAAIHASLLEFGQVDPLIVQKGSNRVIAGNARLTVMLAMGWTHANIIELDVTDERAIALGLAHNHTGRLARWNAAQVLKLVGDLEAFHPKLAQVVGFDTDTLNKLTNIAAKEEREAIDAAAGAERVKEEDDEPVDASEITSKVNTGDVWKLGEHVLICGDCREAGSAIRSLGHPALGLHDPPYGIGIVEGGIADGKQPGKSLAPRSKFRKIHEDDQEYDPTIVMGSAKTVVVWGANHFAHRMPPSAAWIVWDKRVDLPSNNFSDCELAWVSKGGSARILRHKWLGFIRDSEKGEKRLHPTQKPVAILADIIGTYTRPGDVVTDFYLGSGSTLIACERTKRRCIGTEIDPLYCDTIIARWEKATGKTAELMERAK